MEDTDAPRAVLVLAQDGQDVPIGVVPSSGPDDLGLVDDLLRLHLDLGRFGLVLQLREARPDLHQLLDLAGVAEVLGLGPAVPGYPVQASMRSGRPKYGNSSG